MKKKCSTRSAFFNIRALLGFALVLAGVGLGVFGVLDTAQRSQGQSPPHMAVPSAKPQENLAQLKQYWHNRLTYPTGRFDPAWVRAAADQHSRMPTGVPGGVPALLNPQSPLALKPTRFTPLGPQWEQMAGCSNCEHNNWRKTEGRVNAIAVDPTTTVNESIVAYLASAGGGVWKTTNCCSAVTTWKVVTDDLLISTTAIDSITIDPHDHNTIYAGTGGGGYGGGSYAFAMGSQGILKSTDAGVTWRVLGPTAQFPEFSPVRKVRVDPNDSKKVVVGTTTGLVISYDGGVNWIGCPTNNFEREMQDITGLELSNIGGTTRIIAAVGWSEAGTNGANGIYKATMGSSECPSFTSIASNDNGFVFGTRLPGSPYDTGALMNAGSGTPYPSPTPTPNPSPTPPVGNQLGRIDIAVAPSDPNYIYAQVQSIAPNDNAGCNNKSGCQLGAWASTDGGANWSYMKGSQGGALRDCKNQAGDYNINDSAQGVAVDPIRKDRVFFDTFDVWFAEREGTAWKDLTCGFSYPNETEGGPVHVDQRALAFVPGSSSILLLGNDGGVHGTINADTASAETQPIWFNMDTGLNTIQFFSGDISGDFANAPAPQASGGSQDNGSSSVTFAGSPNGPKIWQEGQCCDGFYSRIDPVGTGRSLRFWQSRNGENGGELYRCVEDCTAPSARWSDNVAGGGGNWSGDMQSPFLPFDLFHGGIPHGDRCGPRRTPGGCSHLIAGTTRVWETIRGGEASFNSNDWYITNNPANQSMTKPDQKYPQFINQVKYSPKYQTVAMVGTSDGNVWIGFNLGTGTQAQANWVNVTECNTVLPNRPVLGIALDPSEPRAKPRGYAAIGGFNPAPTPAPPATVTGVVIADPGPTPCPTPTELRGHVFQVTCTSPNCGSFTWTNKTGDLPDIPADAIIVNPNIPQQVFVGTVWGVYYTDDIMIASPKWKRFENGIPHAQVWDMQIDSGATTLSVWTHGRGAYAYPLRREARPDVDAPTLDLSNDAPQ